MSLKVIISGGGTGGHIFPAIAIANAVRESRTDADILFVGANGKMEMEKVPAAGYPIEGLSISGIDRKLSLRNLTFPFRLLGSLLAARHIIKRHRPNVVVGVGGFASGPVLLAAQLMGVPTLIQEQNSYAGVTNRWLGRRAKRICVAWPGMERFFPKDRIMVTGNPVRKDISNDINAKRTKALSFFGLDLNKPVLLVVGGSLGARSINQAIEAGLGKVNDAGVQLIWQTGKLFKPNKEITGHSVHQFIQHMDLAYAAADAVVSRAGASSLSELCIVGRASVLVPFPFAAEDHQTVNARALVNGGAAILVTDAEARESLVNEALKLINDPARCRSMSEMAKRMALPNADKVIANEVIKLGEQ